MKTLITTVLLTAIPLMSNAQCVGTSDFQTCSDNSGNSYNVYRYDNTTQLNGYNSSTGNNWEQTSTSYGDTTFHSGTSSDGGHWNGTSTSFGDTTIHSGIDSSGTPYSKVCNSYGCN